MALFLIEFRLHGYAKEYTKGLIYDVAKKFGVKGVTRRRPVPHISLYGPSEADNIERIVSEVERFGRKYTLVPFKVKGFGYFKEEHKVIYLDMDPSSELKELRWELAQRLSKISAPQPWDVHRRISMQQLRSRTLMGSLTEYGLTSRRKRSQTLSSISLELLSWMQVAGRSYMNMI